MYTTFVKNKAANSIFNIDQFLEDIIRSNDSNGFKHKVPLANIIEKKDKFQIDLAIPGFTKEEIKLSYEKNILNIKGEKKLEETKEDDKITRQEFSYQSFQRSFSLPKNVVTEKIEAKYDAGILSISILKNEENKENSVISIEVQ